MKLSLRLMLTAALLAPAGVAVAHHSYAMFDMSKTVALQGSVIRFKWQNPHAFIEMSVTAKGQAERWAIEMTSPNNLVNDGWKRSSLKPGEKVTVQVHPLRDGSKGGSFVAVRKVDGSTLGDWQ